MPGDAEFVGRVDQMELLSRRLTDARHGHARTVLVGGEAGVGKSELLARFARAARSTGAHVLSGACEEHFGDPVPYAPLPEVLETFRREIGDDRAATLAGAPYQMLNAFFELGSDSMSSPQQVFLAVRRLLDDIGTDAPVVLIMEDLHWADPSTLDLVRHLGQARPESRRLLLVCTFRSGELRRSDPLWQLLASAAFLRRTERIELPAFTLEELRQFLTAMTGTQVEASLVERCHEWSDGIPFYAEQLMATGALENLEDVRLPADTSALVLARLDGLGKPELQVLRVAAVAGRAVSRQLLRTVSGMPSATLRSALQECFDRRLLVADHKTDVYRFRHALLREAMYQSTVRDTLVDLHVAMAEALAADSRLCLAEGSSVAEQSRHWYQAGVWSQALTCAIQAGEIAARTLAFSSAEAQFSRALQLWRQVEDAQDHAGMSKVQLLAWAADAARWSGHLDRALGHIQRAIAEAEGDTDAGRQGERYERLGTYLWEAGRRAESGSAFRQAEKLLDAQPPSAVKARVMAGIALAHLQAGHYAEGQERADAALAMAQEIDARAEEGRALNISGLALGMQGDPRGETRLRRALDIARTVNHIEDLLRGYGNLGLILEHAGRLREAADETMAGLDAARRLDLTNSRQGRLLANNASAALVLLGEWDEAEKIINELSLDRPPTESLYPRLTLAEIKVARGEFHQAHDLLASIEHVEHGQDPRFLGPLHAIRASLALAENNHALAVDEVTRGVEAIRSGENALELLRLCALGMKCAADQAAVGEADRATAMVTGDWLAQHGWDAAHSPASAEITQLVRACQAERLRIRSADTAALWSRIADGWATLDRPYSAAYARWRQAVAADAAGHRADARRAAREAHLAAQSLGAAPLRAEVARLARRIGLDLTDYRVSNPLPYNLTAAEFETLRHLSEGHDARRIAVIRGVSVRTTETQLRSVYRKLGAQKAIEAVAIARREGLFSERT